MSKSVIKVDDLIQVHFPFEKPYACQENYIKSLVKALRWKQNALLESPTGTGKTLCLLSATLGFLNAYVENPSIFDDFDENGNPVKHQNSSLPPSPDPYNETDTEANDKQQSRANVTSSQQEDNEEQGKKNYLNQGTKRVMIIYCTRTHSQIAQVIKEIKTKLAYEVSVVPLASRKHMCVNTDVYEDEASVDQVCKLAREANQKFQKKKFQQLLNAEKVNFRGHQKALMRIMDGTSKKRENANQYTASSQFDPLQGGNVGGDYDDPTKRRKRQLDMRAREEELRKYEEAVFVSNVVESGNMRNKKQFAKDFDENVRKKYSSKVCPYYNGGEKRIFETELNINPFFERMAHRVLSNPAYDIEDLTKVGKIHQLCPYYLARSKLSQVDLAIIPYHYILTPSIRRKLPLQIENSVVIFDEAHNLERICEEIMSFKLSVDKLVQCEKLLVKLESNYRERDAMSSATTNPQQKFEKAGDMLDDTEILRAFVEHLRRAIDVRPNLMRHIGVMPRGNADYYLYDISEVLRILEEALKPVFRIDKQERKKRQRKNNKHHDNNDDDDQNGGDNTPKGMSSESDGGDEQWDAINEKGDHKDTNYYYDGEMLGKDGKPLTEQEKRQRARQQMICKRVDELIEVLDQCIADMRGAGGIGQEEGGSKALNKLKNSLKTVQHLGKISERERADFRLYIEQINYIANRNIPGRAFEASKKVLGYICLNPSYIFKQLVKKKPRSIILTSGTLSPMDSFADELRTQFGVQLENQHAIDRTQLMVSVVQCGINDPTANFHFTYDKRGDNKMTLELGFLIKRLEPSIPGGILVFFPSYDLMQHILTAWDNLMLKFDREVFLEAKGAGEFKQVFDRYLRKVQRGKRAMLMCVCRGKLSEGIDFADDAARAIFVVGVPYPCVNDPRVVQKQEYLDMKVREEPNLELNGERWYKLQASRTVNQAIGRVIRHIRDFGAVYLCDQRYSSQSTIGISKWMRDRKRVFDPKNIGKLENETAHFFKDNIQRFGQKIPDPPQALATDDPLLNNPESPPKPKLSTEERQKLKDEKKALKLQKKREAKLQAKLQERKEGCCETGPSQTECCITSPKSNEEGLEIMGSNQPKGGWSIRIDYESEK